MRMVQFGWLNYVLHFMQPLVMSTKWRLFLSFFSDVSEEDLEIYTNYSIPSKIKKKESSGCGDFKSSKKKLNLINK